MNLTDVYLGLGGNIGDTPSILLKALQSIRAIEGIVELKVSRFYLTTPVVSTPQEIPLENYVNAVCHFKTDLKPLELLKLLQNIESSLEKVPKPKDAPRIIDIDILLFGLEFYQSTELTIPHPHWQKRLFVLIPFLDLVDQVIVPKLKGKETIDILKLIQSFPEDHDEMVILLQNSEKKYVSSSC